MSYEGRLAAKLRELVNDDVWSDSLDGDTLVVRRESPTHVEIEYRDSGVGEEDVVDPLRAWFPDLDFDVDIEGGCDSCGDGRSITMTITGAEADIADLMDPNTRPVKA